VVLGNILKVSTMSLFIYKHHHKRTLLKHNRICFRALWNKNKKKTNTKKSSGVFFPTLILFAY